jgi:hypothetical protein
MTLNCKPGDLAVVVTDDPGCEANVGRLVRVVNVTDAVREPGHWWHIAPLGPPTWVCLQPHLGKATEESCNRTRVFIEDRCLRPIRGLPAKTTRARKAHLLT